VHPVNLALTTGAVPVVALCLGALSVAWLCWTPGRKSVPALPLASLGAAVLTVLLYVFAVYVFHWWDASLPGYLYIYAFLAIFAGILAVRRFLTARKTRERVLPVVAAALVLFALLTAVNTAYGQYPSLASLFLQPGATSGNLPTRAPDSPVPPPVTEATWQPPSDMPETGNVYSVVIPESGSGYRSNPALVYLPPAYLASPPAQNLPVLVLLHGQPGSPSDWFTGGQLAAVMDDFAAAHQGLAPVVVVPDLSGAGAANWPLCLDSDRGRSATYLAVDLPAWVRANLAAGLTDAAQWASAGYSYGGTCSVQLAVNFPQVYPTFLDIAGESEPTVPGGRQSLVDTYFGGDSAAFAAQNALDKLDGGSFPDSAGVVVVGRDDPVYAPQGQQVYDAASAAGMDVQFQEVDGGHSWAAWKAGLVNNLDWLAGRLGILGQ
jgi:enterochelin esterase-like enzyme